MHDFGPELFLSFPDMSETTTEATPVPTLGMNGTANKPSRRPPPRLSLASVDHNNIGTLRKLNSVIFPIVYTERFYVDTLVAEHADYCKLGSCKTRRHISARLLTFSYFLEVYYNDIPVGTVCARLEKGAREGEQRLYLMTMGILAVRYLAPIALPSLSDIILWRF